MTTPGFGSILLGGVVLWGIFRRVRRNIGRQKLRPQRAIRSIVILSVVTLFVGSRTFQNTNLLLGLGGGLLGGALLGLLGLRLTKFETTAEGHFYIPNTHIGVALSLLFVGRMLYRFWIARSAFTTATAATQNYPQFLQSPLTLFIFGLTVGYYLVYQTGLLIHSRDKISAATNFSPANSTLDSSRDRP